MANHADRRGMVIPQQINADMVIERVVRGSGIKVQVEISAETHERLKLELLRRKRQGLQSTVDALLLELVERAKSDWPVMMQDSVS